MLLASNDILKKLKVAYSLRSDDLEEMLNADGANLSASEITAFLRPKDDKKKRYRVISDSLLVIFLRELLMREDVLLKERGWLEGLLSNVETGEPLDAALAQRLDDLITEKRGAK